MNKEQYLQNKARQRYDSYVLHFYSIRSIYLQSFMLIPLVVSEGCPGQSSSKNDKMAITPKLARAELQILCIALLLNKISLPTKFHVLDKVQCVKMNKG